MVGGFVMLAAGSAVLLIPSLLGPQAPETAMDAPGYIEESTAAGINFVYDGEWTFFVGGGVAVF